MGVPAALHFLGWFARPLQEAPQPSGRRRESCPRPRRRVPGRQRSRKGDANALQGCSTRTLPSARSSLPGNSLPSVLHNFWYKRCHCPSWRRVRSPLLKKNRVTQLVSGGGTEPGSTGARDKTQPWPYRTQTPPGLWGTAVPPDPWQALGGPGCDAGTQPVCPPVTTWHHLPEPRHKVSQSPGCQRGELPTQTNAPQPSLRPGGTG